MKTPPSGGTKEKSGWAKKLREELQPTLCMIEHYAEMGDLKAAHGRFCWAERIFRKARVCLQCGGRYWHDSESTAQCCDECDAWYSEAAADEEATEELEEHEVA